MQEATLFDTPKRVAHERAQAKAPGVRAEIVRLIGIYGEATLDDICRWLNKLPHQCSGRLTELAKANVIHAATTRNVDGRSLSVYRLV